MNLLKLLESNHDYYEINFDNNSYVFRSLTIKESKFFLSLLKSKTYYPFYVYEQIFNLVFIGEIKYLNEKSPIGHMISIGHLAFHMSLDHNQTDILFKIAEVRKLNPVQSIYEHMRSVIVTAFKSYTLKDIENLTKKEFIELFVVSENILTKNTPNFQRLDLKAIHDKITEPEKPKQEEEVVVKEYDIKQENDSLRSAVGYWGVKEAEELARKEEEEKLRLKILRELDARNKRA